MVKFCPTLSSSEVTVVFPFLLCNKTRPMLIRTSLSNFFIWATKWFEFCNRCGDQTTWTRASWLSRLLRSTCLSWAKVSHSPHCCNGSKTTTRDCSTFSLTFYKLIHISALRSNTWSKILFSIKLEHRTSRSQPKLSSCSTLTSKMLSTMTQTPTESSRISRPTEESF